MSKKTLQHKKKTIADINTAREIDGLCAVFLRAFGYQLEHQINKAKQQVSLNILFKAHILEQPGQSVEIACVNASQTKLFPVWAPLSNK